MITYPKSPSDFRRKAEAGFRRANPDADYISIEWTFGPKRVTYPTGLQGFVGRFVARAISHRTRELHASADRLSGLSVR
jgi:hypothetical protein